LGASHKLVGVLGLVASFAVAISMRLGVECLGADAAEPPYTGLWIYTPYVDPGDPVTVKLFLQGGNGVSVHELHATLDGAPIAIENRHDRERRPSKRFDMGKLEIELDAIVPAGTPRGEHALAFNLDTWCGGSNFSKACGNVQLAAPIEIGGTIGWKLLSALRALCAALVVFFIIRRAWDPVKRWINEGEKSLGAFIAPAFIVTAVVWAWSSYPLFARPIGAALGTSNDFLYGLAIVTWLGVFPGAVRTRHRGLRSGVAAEPPSRARARVLTLDEHTIESERAAGYRVAPEKKPLPRTRTSLDEVAAILHDAFRVRYRRSGSSLLPRWFGSAPVRLEADSGDDVAPGFAMTGHYGYILLFAIKLAGKLGRLELTVDGKTVIVETNDTAADVKARLSAES
jgi:hypothetical protein